MQKFKVVGKPLLERGKEGKGRVQFQNGKVGEDAALYEFSMANFASIKNKFKKVGPKSRVAFLKEAENWDIKFDRVVPIECVNIIQKIEINMFLEYPILSNLLNICARLV